MMDSPIGWLQSIFRGATIVKPTVSGADTQFSTGGHGICLYLHNKGFSNRMVRVNIKGHTNRQNVVSGADIQFSTGGHGFCPKLQGSPK